MAVLDGWTSAPFKVNTFGALFVAIESWLALLSWKIKLAQTGSK